MRMALAAVLSLLVGCFSMPVAASHWTRIVYVGSYLALDENDSSKQRACATFWFEEKTYRLQPANDGSRSLVGLYANNRYGLWGPIISPGCKVGEKREHVVAPSVMRSWNVIASPAERTGTYNVDAKYFKTSSTYTYSMGDHERKPFQTTITVRDDALVDSWLDHKNRPVEQVFRKPTSGGDQRALDEIRYFLRETHQGDCRKAVRERLSKLVIATDEERDGWCRASAERRKLIGDIVSLSQQQHIAIDEWDLRSDSNEARRGMKAPTKSAFFYLFVDFERVRLPAVALVDLTSSSEPRVLLLL